MVTRENYIYVTNLVESQISQHREELEGTIRKYQNGEIARYFHDIAVEKSNE
jgi:nitrogen fixation/metabolism regulation signal transduction histidine kinase